MDVRIRRANPDEAQTLTAIAHAAKRHWRYPESWIEQWKPDLTITPDFIGNNEMFVAVLGDEIVGCCALVVTGSLAEIEHLWVRPEYMGDGVGRKLFGHAKTRAEQQGARAIELSADPNAEGFYERMGAKRIGEVPADVDRHSRVLPRMRIEL
jgi:GNAT superfamily N-acetyltransferase